MIYSILTISAATESKRPLSGLLLLLSTTVQEHPRRTLYKSRAKPVYLVWNMSGPGMAKKPLPNKSIKVSSELEL